MTAESPSRPSPRRAISPRAASRTSSMPSASCPPSCAAVTELRRQGVNLRVVTDNLAVARAIAEAAHERRHLLGAYRDRQRRRPRRPALSRAARPARHRPRAARRARRRAGGRHDPRRPLLSPEHARRHRRGRRAGAAGDRRRRREAPRRRHPLPHRVGRLDADGHALARLHRHHRDAAGRLLLQRPRPGVHRLLRRRRSRSVGAGLGDRPLSAPQPGADRCRRAGALQGHQRPGVPAARSATARSPIRRPRTWR